MTDYKEQDLAAVEGLLASRQQIAEWLRKLEAAGSRTPPSVRDRVRSDYQARLAQVVEQLRAHSDVITSSLNGLRNQAEEYEQLRNEEQETLAEAELRHAVGEYGEEEWRRVEADATGKIAGLDEELNRLSGEISRLEEVLYQIVPPAEPEPPVRPAPAVEAPRPAPQPVAEIPEAPRFVARGGRARESGPVRSVQPPPSREPVAAREAAPREPAPSALDELTFLKSMTLDARPSSAAPSAAPAAVEPKTERPNQTVPKTLKCGECGSLNRPTEWYCERCGAELAAV